MLFEKNGTGVPKLGLCCCELCIKTHACPRVWKRHSRSIIHSSSAPMVHFARNQANLVIFWMQFWPGTLVGGTSAVLVPDGHPSLSPPHGD